MPRFVVVARDPLVAEEAAQARVPEGVRPQRVYCAELSLEQAFSQLGSTDLFASAQAYIYADILDFKLKKAEGERFAVMLERLPEQITLIATQVFEDKSRADEDKAMKGADFQRVAAAALVDDLRRVSEAGSAPRWLAQRARERYALVLSPAQAERLLEVGGGRLALADGELKKLALLKSSDKPQQIPDALLEQTLSMSPAAHFYELTDALMAGAPDAQRKLQQWYLLEPETFRLLSELRRRLLALRSLSRGEPVFPPFLARQLQGVRRHWPPVRVARAIEELAEMEFRLKMGLVPGESSKDAELSALQVLTAKL